MQEQGKFQDKANSQISIDIDVMIFLYIRAGRKDRLRYHINFDMEPVRVRPSGMMDVVVRYSIFHSDKSATLDDYGALYSRQGSYVEL